jgi:glucokinase
VSPAPPSAAFAGLDIGGSKTLAVAVDRGGRLLAQHRAVTEGQGPARVLASSRLAIESVAGEAGLEAGELVCVGVGIPGSVDHREGTVRHAVNLGIGSSPFPIGALLAEAFGVDVAVENDVNAAALGAAAALGLGERASLAYLSVGTGVAAGLVVGGAIHRGAHGAAGEIGHLPLFPDGPVCECGMTGCLEAVASGSALGRIWPDGSSPGVALFRAAGRGDPRASALAREFADRLARAVLLLALTWDPSIVVLGGGAAEVGEPLVEAVREALERVAAQSRFVAGLGLPGRLRGAPSDLLGALGAVEAARRRNGHPPA